MNTSATPRQFLHCFSELAHCLGFLQIFSFLKISGFLGQANSAIQNNTAIILDFFIISELHRIPCWAGSTHIVTHCHTSYIIPDHSCRFLYAFKWDQCAFYKHEVDTMTTFTNLHLFDITVTWAQQTRDKSIGMEGKGELGSVQMQTT